MCVRHVRKSPTSVLTECGAQSSHATPPRPRLQGARALWILGYAALRPYRELVVARLSS